MKNLIIDTSMNNIKLLLEKEGEILFKEYDTNSQSTDLISFLLGFLKDSKIEISDLDKIGVVVGPGSYTGIRLSIAFAKGLSIGAGIKLVPISVFDIYSEMAKNEKTMITIDSNRGDFFVAVSKSSGEYIVEPCTMTEEEIENTMKKYDVKNRIGDKPYDLNFAIKFLDKNKGRPMIPLYLRPSYAEIKK